MIVAALSELPDAVDLLIIGGGISGAGIAREAARGSAKVLLVDAQDFSAGTSSRSSKLVHGGLRYLKSGDWRLTLESVRERQLLMEQAPGLVVPQSFVMPLYQGRKPGKATMQLGLGLYDAMARQHSSRFCDLRSTNAQVPGLAQDGLIGAMRYTDAQTDDSRLVLRLLSEAQAAGVMLRNYCRAELLTSADGHTTGATLTDADSGERRAISAKLVLLATGAWPPAGPRAPKIRPLRGSHLLFPFWCWPLAQAVSWLHAADGRPVFAYPWEGATLLGTTDLDHGDQDLWAPQISAAEIEYLLAAAGQQFPSLELQAADALSAYAGVRPIVDDGSSADPSAASRESVMWSAPGLVGLSGGKLTTFRVQARAVLAEVARQRAEFSQAVADVVFDSPEQIHSVPRRIAGRLGSALPEFIASMPSSECAPVGATPYWWAELRWALRHEAVRHLDELLLRRTRLGLVSRAGGAAYMDRIRELCMAELDWGEATWTQELQRYQQLWCAQHDPLRERSADAGAGNRDAA